MLRLYLLCLVFFVDGLGGWMGETSDCFMDNGARYWRLIDGLFGVIEEIKNLQRQDLLCVNYKLSKYT